MVDQPPPDPIQWSSYILPVLAVILVIVALSALYMAVRQLRGYFQYATRTPAKIQSVEVISRRNRYRLRVCYSYKVKGWEYEGSDLLKVSYKTEQEAHGGARALEAVTPMVYYLTGKPDRSGLRRRFPLKSVFFAILVMGIAIALLVLLIMYYPQTTQGVSPKQP